MFVKRQSCTILCIFFESLITPIYKSPRSTLSITKKSLPESNEKEVVSELANLAQKCSSLIILLCIVRELAGGGSWLWLLALVTCDRWQVTCDMWHVTYDMWHLTSDPLFLYWCFYPRTSRDSVSPVCGICFKCPHSKPIFIYYFWITNSSCVVGVVLQTAFSVVIN